MAGTQKKGIIIDLGADVSDINKALRQVKGEIISLQKDFSALKKETSFDDTHIKGLRQQFEILGKTVDAQKEKIALYDQKLELLNQKLDKTGDELQDATNKFGEHSKEVKDLTKSYNGQQDVIDKLNRERNREQSLLDGNIAQLRNMEKEINSVSDAYTTYSSSFAADTERVRNSISDIEDSFNSFNKLTKFDSTKLTAFTNQLDLLGQKAEQQETLLRLYDDRIDQVSRSMEDARLNVIHLRDAYGDNSDEVKKADAEYQNLYAQLTKLNKERSQEKIALQTTQAEYDDLSQKLDNTADAQKRLENATSTVTGKVDAFTIALGNLISRGVELAVDKLRDLATQVYEVGTGFEDAVTEVAAVLELSKYSDTISELSDYFEELSLNTRYSAEEMANNAAVLANAGYSANEIKDSLKAISDLAAGTGEEFTTMANVTVDGLAAMGYAASDAQHFVDVLAKSAIVSNTDVTQMGEALSYAGSVAGTFGYSVEDVTIALGAMATQGIKSTSAGTALRSLITRLAANTSDARTEFERLGGTFFDAEGNAVPLKNVLDDLRRILGNMNDEQAAAFEYTLAGQRGLTGLSAIINTTTEDWEALSTAVYDYNGTVAGMVNTRMDSLSGDVAILKNNWEDVTRELYSGVEPSVRKVTSALTKMMQSEAFRGDIEKMADDASEAFEWLAKVIESTDGNIIDMAGDALKLVGAFSGATIASKGVLGLASGVSGLVSNLKAATSGGLSFKNVLGALTSNASVVSIGVGLLATAITAVGNAAAEHREDVREYAQEIYGLDDATQETLDRTSSLIDRYDSVMTARQESMDSIESEYGMYKDLIKEYDGLIDANGNVKTGYEDRANLILGILSEATGMEITDIQSLVTEYGNLSSAMQDVMVKMQAKAILSANEQAYAEAIKSSNQAQEDWLTLSAQIPEAEQKLAEAKQKVADVQNEWNSKTGLGLIAMRDYAKQLEDAQIAESEAQASLDELTEGVDGAKQAYEDYNIIIGNYQGLTSAMYSGDIDEMIDATNRFTWNLQSASNTNIDTLAQQAYETSLAYNDIQQRYANGEDGITQDMVSEYGNRARLAEGEFQKAVNNARAQGDQEALNFADGASGREWYIRDKFGGLSQDVIDSFQPNLYSGGQNAVLGAINGALSLAGKLWNTFWGLGADSNDAYNRAIAVGSPSKEFYKSGAWSIEGAVLGAESKLREISRIGEEAALTMQQGFEDASAIVGGSMSTNQTSNYDNSTFSPSYVINIYGGDGMDEREIAQKVSEIIENDTERSRKIWA